MTRTFLALDLDESSRRALANLQQRLMAAGAVVRWTAPENLHVTLKFLGEVTDEDLPVVCGIARDIASQIPAFEFTVDDVVSAPPTGHMRMVWVEIGDPTDRMGELARRLNDEYASLGYKYENRTFRPHLTLGRVKSGRNVARLRELIEANRQLALEPQYAEEMVVYSSQLTREGPIYTPLTTAELAEE